MGGPPFATVDDRGGIGGLPSLAGRHPSSDGLAQSFEQSLKMCHALAQFAKLVLHRIKPLFQPTDPLIETLLEAGADPADAKRRWQDTLGPRGSQRGPEGV